jgi:hypothetical protein
MDLLTYVPARGAIWISTKLWLCLLAVVLASCGGSGSDQTSDAPSTDRAELIITTQPAEQSVVEGAPASFRVDAVGSGPLSYQWRRNDTPLQGGNDKTYTLAAASGGDDGSTFSVLVSDGQKTIASVAARLTVTGKPVAPSILVPPADQSALDGTMVTFAVTANGTAPLAYAWQRNGVLIPGEMSATLTFRASQADHGSKFRVIVSNHKDSVTSTEGLLSVNAAPTAPTIGLHPASNAVIAPESAIFSATAYGTAPLAYQWRRNGVPIPGADAATYSTPPTTLSDSGSVFTLVVSNVAGAVTSDPAMLSVSAAPVAPVITMQPADQSVTQGQTASFSVTASGTDPLTYQWGRNGVNITGANASVYTTPATLASTDNGAQYEVVISNGVGGATSRKATLTVAVPTSRLEGLLASIPEGGWVKASTNSYSDAWPTGMDRPPPTPSGPTAVIEAWSGFAWDARRSQLMLWGGGHANYVGNEVYIWRGSDGRWTRGSLPSRVNLNTALVEGNGAPQSSHTYQTNSYAPLVDRFVVFGGAAWPTGGPLFDANGRTGAWWWDPNKGNPDLVGGQDGTGWDPSRPGSYAWQMRPHFPWVGMPIYEGPTFVYGTSAYRQENGQDVIYLTMDSNASGWPNLYRYQLGTPTTPDLFQRVGAPSGKSIMSSGAADIDTRNGLFVRTALAALGGPGAGDLAVWRLANNNASNPASNVDFSVQLVEQDGTPANLNTRSSIAYDSLNDQFVIWDSLDQGMVWVTQVTFNPDGSIAPVWVVRRAPSTTTAQPLGVHGGGVLGKWKYVAELKAFIALDATFQTGDVWLYKPPVR